MDSTLIADFLNTMPKEEILIQDFIRRVGVVRVDQLIAILGFSGKNKDKAIYYLNDLLRRGDRVILTDNNCVVDLGRTAPNYNVFHCLWDVVYNLNNCEVVTVENGEEPTNLIYLTTDGHLRIVTYIAKTDIAKVLYLQERYGARHIAKQKTDDSLGDAAEDYPETNVFVVDSETTAARIKSAPGLTIPYEICICKYPKNAANPFAKPSLEYV